MTLADPALYGLVVAHRRRLGPTGTPRAIGCASVIPAAPSRYARLVDQLLTALALVLSAGRHVRHRGDIRRRGITVRRPTRCTRTTRVGGTR